MDITPSVSWLDLRAALFLLCMVPLLCSSKETKSVSIEPKQQVSYEDFVNIHNLPKYATDSDISVEYMCTKPCVIHVDIMASSEFRTGILVFKKRWKNEKFLGVTRTRSVSLVFPRHMVYRIDYFQKHSINVYFSVVRAWLVHNDTISMMSKYNETILNATARSSNVLEPVPLLQRPYRDRQICLSWDFEVTWRKRENSLFICPFETDLVTMLGFPLASSSEHNGIVATFDRFRNRELELRRQQRISGNPRFTFSAWMYLLNFCSGKECGILHHIDSQKKYATPLLFLNEKGQMHVQMQVATGAVVAVLSNLQLPLHRWFRFDITVRGHKIELATSVGAELKSSSFQTYNLVEDNYFDDTDGYMVIGGSKYMLGIDGFFGPVKYYRLRALTTDDISNPILEEEIYPLIAEYYQRCSTAQDIVTFHASVMRETQEIQAEGISRNDYVDLYFKHRLKTTCPVLPVREEERHQYSHLLKFLKSVDFTSSDSSNAPDIGRMLYQSVIERLRDSLRHLGAAVPSLQDASCLGNHKASYLLAAMYEVGLDAPTDPVQGLLYSLVGAQGGDRLALLKLGYHHLEGIHSYPLDLGISYAYYFSVAKKTPQDRWTKHEQAYVETIRLMDDHVLKEQTRENDDLFMWLKQNAERGDARAQHRLAQMYFWGQQGVTKNIDAALQWYERGALENNDPLLMYDYAIILLKGDSVPKNKKLALKLMKKSAAKGQHEAFNGLGWYYHTFLKDYGKAAKYWKKAYDMGNVDAAFNLGIMHLNGVHPGEPEANHTQAFKFITRASTGGHLEGTVHLSQFLITGSMQGVKRDPKEAIRWAKVAAEQNGLIGHVIRKALNAYIDGSLSEALLYYTLTAEAGIEVAQTNLAYICEEHPDITTPYLRETCAWNYYNRSVYQNNPSSYALLKMGDLYYSGSRDYPRNLDLSMRLYSQAALQGDAQGYYNLAVLTQEGISIPTYLLQYLKINGSLCGSKEALALELYDRCQRHSNEDIVSPCSLVLLYHHVTAAWKSILHSSLMYMLGSFILSLTVTVLVRCIHLVQDISSSENSNHLPEGERGGPSAPMMRQTHSVPAGLQRFYTYHLAQTIRRHREWLCPALLVCLCMVYLSFITRSI